MPSSRKIIASLEHQLAEARSEIESLKAFFSEARARHRELINQGNEAYRALQEKSKLELTAVKNEMQERLSRGDAEYQRLRSFLDEHGGREAWQEGKVLETIRVEQAKAQKKLSGLEAEYNALLNEVRPARLAAMDEAAGLHEFDHPARDSITLGVELKNVQSEIANLVRGSTAVSSPDDFELPSTKARRTKFNKDSARLVLRAFNAEVENIIDSATATNYETCVNRIYKSAEALEKLTEVLGVKINPRYLELRIRELNIATRHLDAKKLERELDRERKAQLREQAQAERELEAERQRLEKERQHYFNVLETVQAMGDESEVAKLQAEIVAIEKGIHDVEAREANIRAGYVYVISNIGSFGERLVKIGMTRRLDPMDRVRELGDASVPFNFDVHAMFFSDDAVGVEAELHRRFADKRANLVNTRREFFAVTPHEVREALTAIDGNLLEFTEEAEAEQFRLSQRLRESQLA